MPIVRPIAVPAALAVALAGCASRPEGRFIVLHKPQPPARAVKKPVPATATAGGSVAGEAVPLSAAEKEALFRTFDDYLGKVVPP